MNTVRVWSVEQGLEAGFPRSDRERGSLLFDGPAYLTSPARAWQRAAALEGIYGGSVLLHTTEDLTRADWVEVQDEYGTTTWWRVLGSARAGVEWRLEVTSREVAGVT